MTEVIEATQTLLNVLGKTLEELNTMAEEQGLDAVVDLLHEKGLVVSDMVTNSDDNTASFNVGYPKIYDYKIVCDEENTDADKSVVDTASPIFTGKPVLPQPDVPNILNDVAKPGEIYFDRESGKTYKLQWVEI